MPVELVTLRKRRDGYRGRSSTAVNTAMGVIGGAAPSAAQLQRQMDVLQRLQITLEDHDIQILDYLIEADDIEAEIADSGTYIDSITTTLSALQEAKTQLTRNNVTASAGPAVNVQANPGADPGPSHAVARLPQLELPKFSGDALQWCSFWDSYDSSIHSNGRLSDVDKFNYLRSLLRGVALDAIAGIAVTNASYATAFTLIRNRFGQPQAIINAHVEALVNLSKATEETSRLRYLYDNAEIHIRGLETLGVTSALNGAVLTPILLTKIPDDIRLIITRKNDGPIGDLDRLRDLLRVEVEARELSMLSKKSTARPQREVHEFSTGSLLKATARNGCFFCQDTRHHANKGQRYVTSKDREAKALRDRLCLNCLSPGHRSSECNSLYNCQVCQGKHHTSLCSAQASENDNARPQKNFQNKPWNSPRRVNNSNVNIINAEENNDNAHVAINASPTLLSNTSSVWMQTAIAKIADAAGILYDVRLLFDTGSDRSYVTSSLAKKLSLQVSSSVNLSIAPFGQQRFNSKRFDVTEFKCSDSSGHHRLKLSAVIVPTISCPIYRTNIKLPSSALKNLKLADPQTQSAEWMGIDILIGLDHYWELVQDHIIRLPDENLIAMSSVFGWMVSGTIRDGQVRPEHTNALFIASVPLQEDYQLTKFWETESLEFAEDPSKQRTIEQDLVLQRFDDTITIENNRYEVRLPWKEDGPELPSNYCLSMKRFRNLIRRLNTEDVMPQYNDVITDQIKRGFIEEVKNVNVTEGVVYYIPHHPVIKKDNATTKLRIVYDASAKQSERQPSLNESLYSGPNLISDLLELLLEFRQHKIVLLADIEKAFLQVSLHPKDRDATRFFWLKDPTKDATKDNLIVYRFCRVPFGATSSPFLLAATLRYHLMHTDSNAAKQMLNHFYVDNLVTGATNVHDASAFYFEAKQVMSNVGMNLREWVSNCSEFLESIPTADRAAENVIKVLGIPWHVGEDSLSVKGVPVLADNVSPTKRQILQTISKIFDPLGLVSPVVIKAKVFIQSLWKANLPWDEVPAPQFITDWNFLNAELCSLDDVKVPRNLRIDKDSELHVFVDASAKAYAAVAYIRTRIPGSTYEFESRLVCSRSRVAPVKQLTTPRLELMAAVVGCQLAALVQKTYSISKVQLWSDSEIVLHWIANPTQKQGVFVSNRIRAIKDNKFPFRYVPTKDNPADLPSRGTDTCTLMSSIWWKGPSWMAQAEDHWPANTVIAPLVSSPLDESIGETLSRQHSVVAVVTKVTEKSPPTPFGIVVQKFSSLPRLLRVTSLCTRFVKRLVKKPTIMGPVTSEEYASAMKQWIQFIQRQGFGDQLQLLRNKRTDSTIRRMQLFINDDLLRCRGRFDNSPLSPDANYPILLPKKNKFTDLVIAEQHSKLFHQRVRHTLSVLRQVYWIPSGRQQVRYVLKNCGICRLWEGASYSSPIMPPLPSSRVTSSPAFTFSGCDFAGPLYVFQNRRSSKAYICLFTCAVTRALHLEVVEDLSTKCFLMALLCFISRRGCPKEIISDNAKTFKLSKQVLDKLWHDVVVSDETVSCISAQGIKWKFNVERAPWWGGFFEKMVGLTKRVLIKAVGRSKLTLIELTTTIAEVEAILNSRPLTYVYDDLSNGLPLCPANFLAEANSFALPRCHMDIDPEYKDPQASTNALINKLRLKQQMLDRFWKLWLSEYLPGLREFHHQQKTNSRNNPYIPHVGDVVLIKHDSLKRAHWKLAIILLLYPGKDGQVRAVQLKSKDGQILQRPVSLLYPLEIKTTQVETSANSSNTTKERRTAAIKAEKHIKELFIKDANT